MSLINVCDGECGSSDEDEDLKFCLLCKSSDVYCKDCFIEHCEDVHEDEIIKKYFDFEDAIEINIKDLWGEK